MQITEVAPGDRDRLVELVRREKSARMRDRYRAVLLALEGEQAPAIATRLGRSRRAVQDWVYRYRDRGLDGLAPTPQPGQPQRLPRHREQELCVRLDAGPTDEDGVCTLRGKDVVAILEKEFGVRYTLNGAYCLLQRLGYSSLSPRPRHEHADPQAQERFRRDAPFLPAGSATPSSRSAGGCGPTSSTRPASDRRAP